MSRDRRRAGGSRPDARRAKRADPDEAERARIEARAERNERARETGAAALNSFRLTLARTAADLIRSDPADAATALEMGLVDRKWLEQPGAVPLSTTTPAGVVERFLERAVERRPSRLSTLGLSALQLLCNPSGDGSSGTAQELAVLFTDLEGFTAFTDTHGDEAALELLESHYRAAGPLVRRYSGKIVKRLGDGLLCTFADADSGLRAALEMLDEAPEPLRLRAGLHIGSALVSLHDVVGQAVNVTARVAETARGGQIAVTEEAMAATGEIPNVHVGKPRSRRLKGISDPVKVHIVTKVV